MHVHCAPEDNEEWQLWKEKLNSRSESVRRGRTSDKLLYYAVKDDRYLILVVDSHSLMQPPLDKLNALASKANEYFSK